MGIPYNKYIQFLRSSKKKRRQLACFVTALSVFVSGGVFWQLRGIGTAMVDENLPNADDSDEAITVTPLNASELETQDVWEATLPPLTDIASENLARIAESQLGYSESSVNFVHAEDGETHNGYTRYGAWYGNPYGEWNTMFTYFCLNYAGVSSDDIPYGSGCWAWSLELDKAGLIVPVTRGSPARGDILLIDSDLDGKADRSCIVQSVSDDEISAVEGDIDGCVALTSYLIGDEQLLGMVSLADIVPESTVLPEEPAEVDFSAESESGITIEAHADRGAFPPDTEMFVFDISQDEAVQAAADHFGDEAPDDIQAVAVDITFRSPDGEELEPAEDSQVRVSIVLPEEQSLTGGEFSLLHISDDGDVQTVENAMVSPDSADFVAEEFSIYVLTSSGEVTEDTATMMVNGVPWNEYFGNNSTKNIEDIENTSTTRYHLPIGNPIEVSVILPKINDSTPDTPGKYGNFTIPDNGNPNILRRASDGFDSLTVIDDQNVKITAKYYGFSPGNCRIKFTHKDNSIEEVFLTVENEIFIETPLGEISKDRIHEYLIDAMGIAPSASVICNSNGDPVYYVNEERSLNRFVIPPNGEFTLVSYSTDDSVDYTIGDTSRLSKTGSRSCTSVDMSFAAAGAPQMYRISQRFKAGSKGGGLWDINTKVDLKSGNTVLRSFYVNVCENEYTHSDIEIADGSFFRFESTETLPDGSIKTQTIKYDAYVTAVEHSYLFDKDGNRVKNINGNTLEYIKDDYTSEGEPGGSSQYELTSQRKCSNIKEKHYDVKDVYSAEFDVEVLLKANSITETITKDGVTTTTSRSIKNDPEYPESTSRQIYHLGYDSVVAALNKCPNHTGLDFNIKSDTYLAMIQPKALKKLSNETPGERIFDFELVSDSNEVIATVRNDPDGNIVFPKQVFMKEGTYNYTIREKQNSADTAVTYDTNTHQVVITVSKDGDGKLTATITYDGNTTIPTFNNTFNTYTLPATGGTGELPYILFGSAMLSGAFILLFIRRKKEAAH